jgi:hypothetical protein
VLGELTRRFTEADVAMMLTLLNAVGLQLRSADPSAMMVCVGGGVRRRASGWRDSGAALLPFLGRCVLQHCLLTCGRAPCLCLLLPHALPPQDFVLAVHARAATAGEAGGMTKRAEIMLELVMDIKNNRVRDVKAAKAAAAAAAAASGKGGSGKGGSGAGSAGRGGAAAVLQPGLLKWLKQAGVSDVTLGNISWAKLVQPDKKGEECRRVCGRGRPLCSLWLLPATAGRHSLTPHCFTPDAPLTPPSGMWWHPAATDAAAGLLPGVLADTYGGSSAAAVAAAAAVDGDDGFGGGPAAAAAGGGGGAQAGAVGAAQLLQLAAGLRMTTDVRRAVFVAIMGSEDCAEACEKLLRLPLKVCVCVCFGGSVVCRCLGQARGCRALHLSVSLSRCHFC